MSSKVIVKSLDHIVLTVASPPATISFYETHLGMRHESFTSVKDPGITRHALVFGSGTSAQKINLHQAGKEFEPKAKLATPGSADVCFVSDTPIEEVLSSWKGGGLEILEEGKVVERTGARGTLRSVYTRDPDGNLIE